MTRTVQVLERAGANALQIEDQVFPKRCGHFAGKEVIPKAEMVAKLKAAVDHARDRDLLIIARTDAIAPRRLRGGARSRGRLPRRRRRRHFRRSADRHGGDRRHPPTSAMAADHQHRDRRAHAGTAERAAQGTRLRRRHLRQRRAAGVAPGDAGGTRRAEAQGTCGDATSMVVDFSERQRLVGKDAFDAWSANMSASADRRRAGRGVETPRMTEHTAGADRRRRAGRTGARRRSRLARHRLHADREDRRRDRAAEDGHRRRRAPWNSAGAGASPTGCATRPIRATIRRTASTSPGSTATSSAASHFPPRAARSARRRARRSASACRRTCSIRSCSASRSSPHVQLALHRPS